MDTQLLDAIRLIIREEVQKIVREVVHEEIQIALKPINARLDKLELEVIHLKTSMKTGFKRVDTRLKAMEYRLTEQDDKLDTILEGWQIQKAHREELDDHEERITTIEQRIPAIS